MDRILILKKMSQGFIGPFTGAIFSSPEPLGSQGELIGWP